MSDLKKTKWERNTNDMCVGTALKAMEDDEIWNPSSKAPKDRLVSEKQRIDLLGSVLKSGVSSVNKNDEASEDTYNDIF